MSLRHGETEVTALADDLELFRYVYRPGEAQLESPRPFFHPVRTLRGDLVTIYRPHDHVWHKGIALSLPHVGTENFWGGPTFRNGAYVQEHNDGAMRHDGFDVAVAKDDVVRLDERLTWVTEAGQTPVTERRRIAATVLPDDGRRRGVAARVRDHAGQRQRHGDRDRQPHHGGQAERRLRRPVLARPAVVYRRDGGDA